MDLLISYLVAEGVPAWIIGALMKASGFHGAARITTALSAFGPGGILGGLVMWGVARITGFVLAETIITKICKAVIKQQIEAGRSTEDILRDIDAYRISGWLRDQLRYEAIVQGQLNAVAHGGEN